MATRVGPLSVEAWEAIRKNGMRILGARDMKVVQIAKNKDGSVDKTVYNVLKGTNPPTLASLEKLAKRLDVPLWILMIPNVPDELCNDAGLKRIGTNVRSFIECGKDERDQIAKISDAFADLCRKRKSP